MTLDHVLMTGLVVAFGFAGWFLRESWLMLRELQRETSQLSRAVGAVEVGLSALGGRIQRLESVVNNQRAL